MSFFDFIAAAEKGAAAIYHKVLATGAEILSWESNPAVTPLVQMGVGVANGMLDRAGAGSAARVVEEDIHAALKQIAAQDPTVPSLGGIGTLVNLAGSVASAIAPQAAPVVRLAEGVVGAVEALAVTASVTQPAKTEAQPAQG